MVDVFSDADFANSASMKSVSGMVVRMYVFWRSKRQEIIAGDLSLTALKPTLWGDNKSANLLAVNPISRDRSKHIRVRHLRVRMLSLMR